MIDQRRIFVMFRCVIASMCGASGQFQLVNPTSQIALYSLCIGNCADLQNIQWNIYQGTFNSSSTTTQWMIFDQMISYENIWFFGRHNTNFTATSQLFLHSPQINFWRFEVVYQFSIENSASTINFATNQPPTNGSCSIDPSSGITTTPFTVICIDWYDANDIKDYSLYGRINLKI